MAPTSIRRAAAGVALFTAITAAWPGWADSQSTVVFRSKAWTVEIVRFDTGQSFCEARTGNQDGTSMALWVSDSDDQEVELQFTGMGWKASPQSGQIRVDVDGSHWGSDATFRSGSIFVQGISPDFLRALANGRVAAVTDGRRDRRIAFSLAGSTAAMGALGQCWTAIGSNPSGPFDDTVPDEPPPPEAPPDTGPLLQQI